ncbi:MAG TPA: hypothetical protein VGY56_09170 [Verrucomicrobiae bacterium]|nr:hypothetical protein [Verrucomicrobiae bacterium]
MGGLPLLRRLCGDCPANGDAGGIAGCIGSFHQELYSTELQEQLDQLIGRLGLASKLDACFPQTRLHWFRFWIQSPIPIDGVGLLHQLLGAVYEQDEEDFRSGRKSGFRGWHTDLNTFVKALERSLSTGIPMYVNLAPPGHADFGWYTIFSHCPRCKAEAPLKRWQRKYEDEEIECTVCGAKYSPAKTHSSERDNHQDMRYLRDMLGQVEFEKFAARCLVAQGASETEAAQIVQRHEEWERTRRERWTKEIEPSVRHERFVEQVIYQGLKNLTPGDARDSVRLLSAEDAEEVFRRCKHHGGKVLSIWHVSESGELMEYLRVSWLTSARKALQKFMEKGCNERFYVIVRIPKEVVEGWKQQQS